MGDQFTPEAKAELLAMYTGMALQGLIASGDVFKVERAVALAVDTVNALEAFHLQQAAQARANATQPDDSVIKAAARQIIEGKLQ